MHAVQPRGFCLLFLLGFLTAEGCGAGSPTAAQSAATPSADAPAAVPGNLAGEPLALAPAAGSAAKPSPAQIAKWAVAAVEPLRWLTCADGFADPAVIDMAVAPDGKQIVLAGAKLTVWDTGETQPKVEMLAAYKADQFERPLGAVAISPDGKWLAAGDQKGRVRVWTLGDQTEIASIAAHNGHINRLAFSPDAHLLATTSYSGEVNLWELPEGKKLKSLKMDQQKIFRLAFVSDSLLASAGGDASLWNIETGTKVAALNPKRLLAPALGLSSDRQLLAFGDAEGAVQFWDVPSAKPTGHGLPGAAAHLIAFSHDGQRIATYSQDSNIRIWDAASSSVVQVIDADGGPTSALAWLPGADALVVASTHGRVGIWGSEGAAQAAGLRPMELPEMESPTGGAHRALSSAALRQVFDVRSFPRLPGAVPQWGDYGMLTYRAPASQREAEQFYRHYLAQAGWQVAAPTANQPGLTFRKQGCELSILLAAADASGSGNPGDTQVTLVFGGNYDARWLPKFKPIESKSSLNSFSSVLYRTKADLTDVEIGLLKQLHDAGWTAYSRLAASTTENPESRSISLLQGGSVLTVSIGPPADAPQELVVQTSIGVSNKSVPIPPDAGWIEYDSSTDVQLVINTKLSLEETTQFFDTQMKAEGWLAREAGRHFKDDKAWLPYLRGQQEIFLRLTALPGGGTRVVAGDAASSSRQLQKPAGDADKTAKVGVEAADFKLPAGASAVKFDVDQKNIEFEVAGATPGKLGEQFAAQMEALGWERDGAGIAGDDYVFITYKQGRPEIQIRARASGKKATAMISGDGLLWDKPLATAPVRISYEAWLRRNRVNTTLDRLDDFAAEMHKIPAGKGK